jgi:hypothetical protein
LRAILAQFDRPALIEFCNKNSCRHVEADALLQATFWRRILFSGTPDGRADAWIEA